MKDKCMMHVCGEGCTTHHSKGSNGCVCVWVGEEAEGHTTSSCGLHLHLL